jgi:hypothetical protein
MKNQILEKAKELCRCEVRLGTWTTSRTAFPE